MKRKGFLLLSAVIVTLASGGTAFPHHASIGTGIGQAGPVTTVSASTLRKGSFAFEMLAEYQNFDTFSDSAMIGLAERGEEDIHNIGSLFSPAVGIAYGVTDNFTLHLKVPYVQRSDISDVHHHEEEEHEIHQLGDAKGIGDMSVFGHYRFLNRPGLQSSLLAGLKMPTGKRSDRTGSGEPFEAEFQPGSGSWDPLIGLAVTRGLGPYYLDSNVLYALVTEGVQDTDLGDVFNYNISIARSKMVQKVRLDFILEANGIWRQKQETGGERDPNSGGNTVLISPGIRAALNRNVVMYFSIGIPVIQDLNGRQNDMEYRTIAGIGLLL